MTRQFARSFLMGLLIAVCFFGTTRAYTISTYFYENGQPFVSDVAAVLGVAPDALLYSTVQDSGNPAGGGIGEVFADTPGAEADFWLNVTANQFYGDENEALAGNWEAGLPVAAFEMKAGRHSMLTVFGLESESAFPLSGIWSLQPLWDEFDYQAALSHFTAYSLDTPRYETPEPASLVLMGIGLLLAATVARRRFGKYRQD